MKLFDIFRSILLNALVVIIFIFVYIFFLPLYIVNRKYAINRFHHYECLITVKMLRLLGLRINLDCDQMGSERPTLIIANHTHLLDVVINVFAIDQEVPVFLSKISWIVKLTPYFSQQILLNRNGQDNHVFQELAKVFKSGDSVVMYPEGRRVNPGEILPYSRSVALIVRKFNIPITLTALNTGRVFYKKYWADFSKTLTCRCIETTTYDKVVFEVLFRKEKESRSLQDQQAGYTYKDLSVTIDSISWCNYRRSKNIFADMHSILENWITFDKKLASLEINDNSLVEIVKNLSQSIPEPCIIKLIDQIQTGLLVYRHMNSLPFSVRDSIFMDYIERTIRSAVELMD